MVNIPPFDNLKNEKASHSEEPIKHLFAQIKKMPELSERAKVVDQVLVKHLDELKSTASVIVEQFCEQKKLMLSRFDNFIMPIAQNVLDNLLQDANNLRTKLEEQLDHIEQTKPEEWNEQAKHWVLLYTKWNDRNGLVEKILEAVVERTEKLIDRDIQVIKDYQVQSLSNLILGNETFKSVEERLEIAIEEPLKQLMSYRMEPKEHTSLQQASEWISNLQERREVCFDQLLKKIDHVIKDFVHHDEKKDMTSFLEIENEIIFMERELHQINVDLFHIKPEIESEKQFIIARLEAVMDHVNELKAQSMPLVLEQRIDALKSSIEFAFSCLP